MPRVPLQQQQSTNMKEMTKKGAWSPEEDQKLKSYIIRYGIWNWNHMPKFAGLSRTGKSCRLRWMNYLRPDVKRGPFSTEEVEIVIKAYQELGNRWSAIAGRLPGRTDNEIKNFFHTHLKKHLGVKNHDAPTRVVKKTKENKRESRVSRCDNSISERSNIITFEENGMMDLSDQTQQGVLGNCYYDDKDVNVNDEPIIETKIMPIILESNPETTTLCLLCEFEYPHPCTVSDFNFFHQFDVLWDAHEHLIF